MRKFLTANGGLPIFLDDLAYISDGANEHQDALAEFFGQNYRLKGAVPSLSFESGDTTVSVSSGYIVLGGQFCRVQADSVIAEDVTLTDILNANHLADSKGVYWTIQNTIDNGGDRQKADLTSHSAYEIREARLNWSDTNNAYIQGSTGWHYTTIEEPSEVLATMVAASIKQKIKDTSDKLNVKNAQLLNGWKSETSGCFFHVNKDVHGWTRISLVLDFTGNSGLDFYDLPSAFQPPEEINVNPENSDISKITIQGKNGTNPGRMTASSTGGGAFFLELHTIFKAWE